MKAMNHPLDDSSANICLKIYDETEKMSFYSLLNGLINQLIGEDSPQRCGSNKKLLSCALETLLYKRFTISTDYEDFNNPSFSIFWLAKEKICQNELENEKVNLYLQLLKYLEDLQKSVEFDWIEDVYKLFIVLARINKNALKKPKERSFKESVDIWTNSLLSKKSRLPNKSYIKSGLVTSSKIRSEKKVPKCSLRNLLSWSADESYSYEEKNSTCSSTNLYELDEGFVTPSSNDDEEYYQIHHVRSSILSAQLQKKQRKIQSCIGIPEPPYFILGLECPDRVATSPRVYISLENFIQDVKALLLGVSTSSFHRENNKFIIRKGLHTDNFGSEVLARMCTSFMKGGDNYLTIEKLCDNLNKTDSIVVKAIKPTLRSYLFKYQSVVNNFPDSKTLPNLVKYIGPLLKVNTLLVSFLSPLPCVVDLLNQLYNQILIGEAKSASSFYLTLNLFVGCCQVYYSLLNDWIFLGETHPDLFIVQKTSWFGIKDRDSWCATFDYDMEKAPSFIPAKELYHCGINLVLLHLCSVDSEHAIKQMFLKHNRPNISLCINFDTLRSMKEKFNQFFLQCSTLLPIFQHTSNPQTTNFELSEKQPEVTLQFISKHKQDKLELLEQRKLKESLAIKECLEEKMKSVMKNIFEEIAYERKIRAQALFAEQNQLNRDQNIKLEIVAHHEKLVAAIEKEDKLIEWKCNRFKLNEIRSKYFKDEVLRMHDFIESSKTTAISPINPFNQTHVGTLNTGRSHHEIQNNDDFSSCGLLTKECTDSFYSTEQSSSNEHTSKMNESFEDINEKSGFGEELTQISSSDDSQTTKPEISQFYDEEPNFKEIPTKSGDDQTTKQDVDRDNIVASYDEDIFVTANDECPSLTENENNLSAIDFDEENGESDARKTHPKIKSQIVKDSTISITSPVVESKCFDLTDIDIDYCLRQSILVPMEMQSQLVNNSLLYIFLVQNDLLHHIRAIRRYFFLSDGLYGKKLATSLFSLLTKKRPSELLNFTYLNDVLRSACAENVTELSLEVKEIPPAFVLTDSKILQYFRLDYKVNWPLNFILTDIFITKCNSIFCFVMALERASWYLEKLFFCLSMKYIDTTKCAQYRQIQLHRHVMTQYMSAFKCYLVVIVFESCWAEFNTSLCHVTTIDALYKAHVTYMKDVRFKCFLNSSSEKVYELIMKMLHQVLVYCQVFEYDSFEKTSSGLLQHNKYAKLNHTFSNFMVLANYFTCVIKSLTQNQHCKHFEVFLNFLPHNSLPNIS